MILDIKDFSPNGDGRSDDTQPIQTAIDQCSLLGGGKLCFEEGVTYVISGIQLKSNVELVLNKGTILKGSGVKEKYNRREGPFERLSSTKPLYTLIHAKGQENIKISGEGIIDGSYEQFSCVDALNKEHRKVQEYPRPTTIYFEDCHNTTISGISIVDVPFWTIHMVGCIKTLIEHITIRNDLSMPNTDGIDIDRCKNTVIRQSTIVTADDAICLKCTEETAVYGDLENIHVSDCHLTSISSAVKFGSSSFGNFYNGIFENLTISNSNRGLAFQIRDTHSVENILFRNIKIHTQRYSDEWWGRSEPIYITICPREENQIMGHIAHVSFEDIECNSENSVFIYAQYHEQIQDISFTNINLTLQEQSQYAVDEFDLRPTCISEIYRATINKEQLQPFIIESTEQIKLEKVHITHRKETNHV